MYHKNMPWGKGVWVWNLPKCMGGDINALIKKCHDYDISYLLVKGGDAGNQWAQLTHDLVTRLHDAHIKVYSWSYVYGLDPLAEAHIANTCLDLGVDGHVFDAESEYEHLPNNAHAAETMLQAVRAKHPDKFLAHAPYPIIDYHQGFPYITFNKYCDAVMPQVYYGNWKKTPAQGIMWMYDNFSRWQDNWIKAGHADAVKPMIPIAQAYDNTDPKVNYTLNPTDIKAFVSAIAGYKSVNFWSFEHIFRTDCWDAIRDAKVDAPTDADLGRVAAPVATTTTVVEQPVHAVVENASVEVPTAPASVTSEVVVNETPTTTTVETATTVTTAPAAALPTETPTVIPQNIPQKVELPASITLPADKTTVTFIPSKDDPSKLELIVHPNKTHLQYFVEFIHHIVYFLKRGK